MIDGRANELPDYQVLRTVFSYCLIIITLPVFSFFVTKLVIFELIFKLEGVQGNVYSAVVAVVVLHVTLGMYIYKAYDQSERAKPSVKRD